MRTPTANYLAQSIPIITQADQIIRTYRSTRINVISLAVDVQVGKKASAAVAIYTLEIGEMSIRPFYEMDFGNFPQSGCALIQRVCDIGRTASGTELRERL